MATYKGISCKAYYNTGTYGSPTWTEISVINDLTQNATAATAEANSRASVVDLAVITSIGLSWSGTMKNDGSATWTAMYEAMLESTVLDMLILTAAHTVNGATGFRADCVMTEVSEDQGRNTRLYNSINIMPTESDNAVKAVLIAGGVPTYATVTGTTLSYA